jgi:hypothetical protein
MHDSGETWGANREAPQNTIKALGELFAEGGFRSFRCVPMDERNKEEQMNPFQINWKKKVILNL